MVIPSGRSTAALAAAYSAEDGGPVMRIAAVIVHYNNPSRLEQVLSSVCGQVHEAIVVDVGASVGDLASSSGGVRRIRTSNDGFGAGLRRGVAETEAEALLLMNHDAVLAPSAVSTMVETLRSIPDAAAVGPLLWDERSGQLTSAGGTINRRNFRLGHHLKPLSGQPYEVDWLDGAATLVRRSAYEAVGGHDDRFFLYYEDPDLCARLTGAGWRIIVEPRASCSHTISGGFHDMAALRERNVLLFTEKAGGRRVAAARCLWTVPRIALAALRRQPDTRARARGLLQYLGRRWGQP